MSKRVKACAVVDDRQDIQQPLDYSFKGIGCFQGNTKMLLVPCLCPSYHCVHVQIFWGRSLVPEENMERWAVHTHYVIISKPRLDTVTTYENLSWDSSLLTHPISEMTKCLHFNHVIFLDWEVNIHTCTLGCTCMCVEKAKLHTTSFRFLGFIITS